MITNNDLVNAVRPDLQKTILTQKRTLSDLNITIMGLMEHSNYTEKDTLQLISAERRAISLKNEIENLENEAEELTQRARYFFSLYHRAKNSRVICEELKKIIEVIENSAHARNAIPLLRTVYYDLENSFKAHSADVSIYESMESKEPQMFKAMQKL